jgi:hypothetical protein
MLSLMKNLALMLGCVALAMGADTHPVNAAALRANAGITFVLAPTTNSNVFIITADGVVQVSTLGNCSEHAEFLVQFPTSAGQPTLLSGAATRTSSDGANTLKFNVIGTATTDPTNPAFFNNNYQATFTDGSGAFASATGRAQINELVKFNSQTAGTGTWTMKGYTLTPASSN